MNFPLKSMLALTICASGACLAQDFQPGVHAAINLPMGDLGSAVDHRLGLTAGGHLGIYYGGGHELRPRADITRYQGGWTPEGDTYNRNTITAWQMGCDYLFYTEARPQNLYLTMGMGYGWWTVDPDRGSSHSTSSFSMAIGAGYRINRSFGVEARFTTGQFQSTNGQASALQLMASMRF